MRNILVLLSISLLSSLAFSQVQDPLQIPANQEQRDLRKKVETLVVRTSEKGVEVLKVEGKLRPEAIDFSDKTFTPVGLITEQIENHTQDNLVLVGDLESVNAQSEALLNDSINSVSIDDETATPSFYFAWWGSSYYYYYRPYYYYRAHWYGYSYRYWYCYRYY